MQTTVKKSVINNAAWIIACKIVQAVLRLVITMLMARYLGPSNYGVISYAASVVAFVVPIMQLGFRNTLVQDFVNSPHNEGRILGTALGLNVLSAAACMVGVCAFSAVANAGEKSTIIVCALYSTSLLFQALEMCQYWFQSKLLSKYTSLTMLAAYVLVSVYKFIILLTHRSIYWFAVSDAIEYMLISVFLIYFYKKAGGQRLSFSLSTGKSMFEKSRYYIVSNLMVTIFAQTDKIMLKLMSGDEITGYYSAAITCANITSFVFYAIIDSVRPSIFQNKNENQQKFEESLSNLYSIIIYFSLVQSLAIAVFAPLVVKILYGAQYEASVNVLRLVVWYTTFSHMGIVRNIWILTEGKQKKLWMINLSGAMLNVVINYLLIPHFGAMGAAFASLMTQIFTNVILGFIMKSIRYNNTLMIKGLNPMPVIRMLKNTIRERKT